MITLKHAAETVAPVLSVAAMMLYGAPLSHRAPSKRVNPPRSSRSPGQSPRQSSSSMPRWPNHSPLVE
jgi:hypothetical protein